MGNKGEGWTMEMTYRASDLTYSSCIRPKKTEENQKEFHLNIPPTVNISEYRTHQAHFPLP